MYLENFREFRCIATGTVLAPYPVGEMAEMLRGHTDYIGSGTVSAPASGRTDRTSFHKSKTVIDSIHH